MNFEGKNCASHASNHGQQGINVLKEAQYIEVFYDNDEYEGGMDEEGHISDQEEAYKTVAEEEKQEENHPSPDKARMAVLSTMPRYHTIRCKGVVLEQRGSVLVDGGDTHNFIYA